MHAGIPPTHPLQDQAGTPLGPGTHPPRTRHHLPGTRHPPPGAEHAGRYGQRAGGMHPTGMQSCLKTFLKHIILFCGSNDYRLYPGIYQCKHSRLRQVAMEWLNETHCTVYKIVLNCCILSNVVLQLQRILSQYVPLDMIMLHSGIQGVDSAVVSECFTFRINVW